MGFDADIADNDDLVIAVDFLERASQDIGRIVVVAGKEVLPRSNNALWRVNQAFTVRVFADEGD